MPLGVRGLRLAGSLYPSFPYHLTQVNGRLLFQAYSPTGGGVFSSTPGPFTVFGNQVLFPATEHDGEGNGTGTELWSLPVGSVPVQVSGWGIV